jgi:DNA repair exonuclease SbcCD ATPase subunit
MIPIKLIIINFGPHSHSTLDFTKFNSALIIGSYEGDPDIANGLGKTLLIDSIRFALFGKTDYNVKTKVELPDDPVL